MIDRDKAYKAVRELTHPQLHVNPDHVSGLYRIEDNAVVLGYRGLYVGTVPCQEVGVTPHKVVDHL